MNPDGTRLYVPDWNSGSLSVIDLATNSVTTSVVVGVGPFGVALDPTGTHVYATTMGGRTLSILNTATTAVVATVTFSSSASPSAVAVAPH